MDSVFLYGIVQSRCLECVEEVVAVPNIKGQLFAIARNLVCKEEMLTGDETGIRQEELRLRSKEMAATLSIKPETYSRWENEKQVVSSSCDKELRLSYILNASEEEGRVLHKSIRGMMTAMAVRPVYKPGRNELSAADWLVSREPPIFRAALCR